MNVPTSPYPGSSAHMEILPASFSARLMAFSIDLCLLFCLTATTLLTVTGTLVLQPDLPVVGKIFLAMMSLFLVLFLPLISSFLYFTVLHATGGQTLGKLFMGIRVTTTDGDLPSAGQSFLRWTGYLVSTLPLAFGFFWAAGDRQGAAWHDHIAGTLVVHLHATSPCTASGSATKLVDDLSSPAAG